MVSSIITLLLKNKVFVFKELDVIKFNFTLKRKYQVLLLCSPLEVRHVTLGITAVSLTELSGRDPSVLFEPLKDLKNSNNCLTCPQATQ